MEVGSCWGMAGPEGRLSVKFAYQIIVDAVSLDHIPAQIAADFSSAPYEFQIFVSAALFEDLDRSCSCSSS
jgi:SUN domain-containing protein 1/2